MYWCLGLDPFVLLIFAARMRIWVLMSRTSSRNSSCKALSTAASASQMFEGVGFGGRGMTNSLVKCLVFFRPDLSSVGCENVVRFSACEILDQISAVIVMSFLGSVATVRLMENIFYLKSLLNHRPFMLYRKVCCDLFSFFFLKTISIALRGCRSQEFQDSWGSGLTWRSATLIRS